MKKLIGVVLALVSLVSLTAGAQPAPARVVTLGGGVTEIVYALGAGDRVVGNDLSSLYPPAATRLPRVGYYRGFSVEGVVSLMPNLVLASDVAGPPASLAQLRKLGVPVTVVSDAPTVDALNTRIQVVAEALGIPAAGTALQASIQQELAAIPPAPPEGPRVLSLMNRTGDPQVAGTNTIADAMLTLVGARNVFTSQSGYKTLAPEALAALAPDVIVVTEMSLQAMGGMNAFLGQPGIASTPAARDGRVVVMDDLLYLGFGPRLPQALQALHDGIYAAPGSARGG